MEIIAGLMELKPDSQNDIENWSNFINNHKEKALETLRNESVEVESFFYIQIDGKDYLLTYQRVQDVNKSREVFEKSDNEVDVVHRKFKECWGKGNRAKLLVDLSI